MRVTVFGGAGFVGSSIALYLAKHYPKYNVVAIDNLQRRGSELNPALLAYHGIRFMHCDIRNREDVEASKPADIMIDASADASVLSGISNSTLKLINTNLTGTINLLELASAHQSKFIFLSTSRVYPVLLLRELSYKISDARFTLAKRQTLAGASEKGISEDFPVATSARSFYGTSKLAAELFTQEYSSFKGLRSVINRFGVIAGPGQFGKAEQGIFSYWLAAHHWSQNLSYIGFGGKGFQVRDFLHINDVCGIVDYQIHHFDELKGQTFNLGGGSENSLSLQELTALCQDVTGKKTVIQSVPENRPADIPWYLTDYSKYRALTGWSPQYDLRTIAEDTYRWMRSNEGALQQIFFA